MQHDLSVSTWTPSSTIGVVHVSGYLGGSAKRAIHGALRTLSDLGCSTVIVDLRDVQPVSCAGMRTLLATMHRWRQRGAQPLLCGLSQCSEVLLKIAGRPSWAPVFRDLEAALLSLESAVPRTCDTSRQSQPPVSVIGR